jgi:hypothetical protein
MRRVLTKRIEMPGLAFTSMVASLVCAVAYSFQDRGGIVFGILCEEIARFFGPLFCLYLFFRLFCEVLVCGGKRTLSFAVGSFFCFGTFLIWYLNLR